MGEPTLLDLAIRNNVYLRHYLMFDYVVKIHNLYKQPINFLIFDLCADELLHIVIVWHFNTWTEARNVSWHYPTQSDAIKLDLMGLELILNLPAP